MYREYFKDVYDMFIFTFKLDKRRLTVTVTVIILALILGITLLLQAGTKDIFSTVENGIRYKFTGVKTNEDRINFLKQFGWEVEERALEVMEVQIPEEFDSVYANYNKMQSEVGLDLQKYMGQRVKRYTYKVSNHPSNDVDGVRANILIYKDRVIAGDIMTTKLDGFMHSLLYTQ